MSAATVWSVHRPSQSINQSGCYQTVIIRADMRAERLISLSTGNDWFHLLKCVEQHTDP